MWDGGRVSDIVSTMAPRTSDRVVVLPRLGNASGGKDPDFRCAFEGAEGW